MHSGYHHTRPHTGPPIPLHCYYDRLIQTHTHLTLNI
ncbi:hypothetical protein KSS87_023019 [Heliosperma pusillum]|nr:hypothetical protein KSS87_023019 [Heliosperma pusillum]